MVGVGAHWFRGFRWPFACIPTQHAASHAQPSENESGSPIQTCSRGSRPRTTSSHLGGTVVAGLRRWSSLCLGRDSATPTSSIDKRHGDPDKRFGTAGHFADIDRDGHKRHRHRT